MSDIELGHVGVIGAGSFGTAIANILSENTNVILLVKDEIAKNKLNQSRVAAGQSLSDKIEVISSPSELAGRCSVIFPIIPSNEFRTVMENLKPIVHNNHVIIHGTKGLDVSINSQHDFTVNDVKTMSEVISEITGNINIGCLAGPNLAKEIAEGKPAATVIASHSENVKNIGLKLLRTPRFQVLISDEIKGIELCGVIKNIIAIAAGAASGLELGENARSLLINRGLVEMIHIGKNMGTGIKPYLGVAGMGDLIATCNSPKSRNYTLGYRLAKGETFEQISKSMEETAEGVNTTRIIYHLSEKHEWKTPITRLVYKVLFENYPVHDAIHALMKLPVKEDISFI